jgi:hypothetical protein
VDTNIFSNINKLVSGEKYTEAEKEYLIKLDENPDHN